MCRIAAWIYRKKICITFTVIGHQIYPFFYQVPYKEWERSTYAITQSSSLVRDGEEQPGLVWGRLGAGLALEEPIWPTPAEGFRNCLAQHPTLETVQALAGCSVRIFSHTHQLAGDGGYFCLSYTVVQWIVELDCGQVLSGHVSTLSMMWLGSIMTIPTFME